MEWVYKALLLMLLGAALVLLFRFAKAVLCEADSLKRQRAERDDVTSRRTWTLQPQPTGEVVVVLSVSLSSAEWTHIGNIRITLAPGDSTRAVIAKAAEMQDDLVEQSLRSGMRVRGMAAAVPGAPRKEAVK